MFDQDSDELNASDLKVYQAVRTFWNKKGYSPTYREIGQMCGIKTPSHVKYCVDNLVEKGWLYRIDGLARAIRLPDSIAKGFSRMPISGRIQAGNPIPPPGSDFDHFDSETFVEISTDNLRYPVEELYALEVKGDSMIDALINDGDVVIMRKTTQVNNGDMVAVWIHSTSETTLKRFYLEGDKVRLQPENPRFQPIILPAEDVLIQGVVVRLIRDFELKG
jgi:repressor LexA